MVIRPHPAAGRLPGPRWRAIELAVWLIFGIIVVRLWQLQVVNHDVYASLAGDQQAAYELLVPVRGEIFATQRGLVGKEELVPLAVNRDAYLIYADSRAFDRSPAELAELLAPILQRPAEELTRLMSKPNDPFEPLARRAGRDVAEAIRSLKLAGIHALTERQRFYPNNNISSHLAGFVSYQDDTLIGQYGLEGSFNRELAGTAGSLRAEQNAAGVLIALGERDFVSATDGSDLVLTIDWTIQYHACKALNAWVARHGASGGSVIVLDPKTGGVLAMCGAPDFNPNVYNETSKLSAFNNPAIFLDYEPGSIMKPITMAAALDQGKVSPSTTYTDEGVVKIANTSIRNSDNKANGVQTMTDVLTKSLNTGAIYAMRQVGTSVFRQYLENFGFGSATDIDLEGEAAGNLKSLNEKNDIYPATASFGQGITATPLQMVTAFAAVANGGELMRPYVVREILKSDGTKEVKKPVVVRRVISEKTAALLSGMLVTVVEDGHGTRAGVPGYYIAGKTGTAQIPRRDGQGYESDASIGSFVGFGPVRDPRFAMIVRVDRPQGVRFAESSAAPLFGDIAKFILQYYEVSPDR